MAVTYSQALLDQAIAYVRQPLTSRRYDQGLHALSTLYAAITGEPAGKCRQCQYSDYLAVVTAFIREATRLLYPETMSESTYTVAPGYEKETFVHESYGKAVTGENLTDADAEFFSQNGYEHAFLKKVSAKAEPEGDKKPKLVKKADYQTRFKELFNTEADDKLTIEQLTQHIEAKEADTAYQVPATE